MQSRAGEKRIGTVWPSAVSMLVLGFVLSASAAAQGLRTADSYRGPCDAYSCRRGGSSYIWQRPWGGDWYAWPYTRRDAQRIDRHDVRAEELGLPIPLFWSQYDRGFVDGVQYGDEIRRIWTRDAALASKHDALMQEGLADFKHGRYEEAAWHFAAAADVQQGDAASRLLAGQAWLAAGEYAEAARHIRRGIELQPQIAGLPLNLRHEYGIPADFDAQVADLAAEAQAQQTSAELWWLLGYEQFFSGDRAAARASFRRAYSLNPRDPLVLKFLLPSDRKQLARSSP
jgi:tetratricopeptide (TPR) repeat protein